MRQLNVLIISRNFPPLTGGMEKLMWNTFLNLDKQYNITFIGPKGSSKFIRAPHTCIECNEKYFLLFLIQATFASWKECRKRTYSFSIGGSGVVGPISRILQIYFRIPSLLFLHGLDIIAKNLIYQTVFLPSLRRANHIITNSRNTEKLALDAGIKASSISVIHPGVDAPTISSSDANIKEKYNLHDKKVILSVGRLIKRKGVLEFVQNSMPRIVKKYPNIVYLIVGDEPAQALKKDGPITKQIQQSIKELNLEEHILLLGKVDDELLFSAYQVANAFIFPILDIPGDVEGFGIVALEAASFGVPTIAFDAGGVFDAVVQNKTGILVPPGDYEEMANTVIKSLRGDLRNTLQNECIIHSNKMSWQEFGNQLLSVCEYIEAKH